LWQSGSLDEERKAKKGGLPTEREIRAAKERDKAARKAAKPFRCQVGDCVNGDKRFKTEAAMKIHAEAKHQT
jgi:hypothetical protein